MNKKTSGLAWAALCSALLAMAALPKAQGEQPIQPIVPATQVNIGMAELGKKLYFDPRLSRSGIISCNTCHNLSTGGTDNLRTSIGHNGRQGPLNAPTVLNASLNFVQFWDGHATDLAEQASYPIANPGEMAFTHTLALNALQAIPAYRREFKLVFDQDRIEINHVTMAIAEFEKTLSTPNSRFDQWLLGKKDALSAFELSGYRLFRESGCIGCHNGAALGGNSFQRMGIRQPYKSTSPSEGRIDITGRPSDRFSFKVPMLRNVELTYPYFHDGAVGTLPEAVDLMGRLQLGRKFTDDENARIVAFLRTLTGDQPRITLPILPPSAGVKQRP